MDLALRIVLENPPAGLTYGLQKGSGANYETVQTQLSNADDLHFELVIETKGERQKDKQPDFKGSFVQGPALSRFIYIGIGAYAGHNGYFNGRLKIPLTGITWDVIDQLGTSRSALGTHVPGVGKNGQPNCATVKPFAGWQVESSK